MKLYPLLLAILIFFQLNAQDQKTEVLTLGTFHFNFPNKDVVQINESDQIDVLKSEHQKEIKTIVQKIKKFNPTVIVIEQQPFEQHRIDSLYQLYLNDDYELKRREIEQIGFRLAKQLGIQKLYCVDQWGEFNSQVNAVLAGNDTIGKQKFTDYYERSSKSSLRYDPEKIFQTNGILAELKRLNDPENIRRSLGNYLIGPFTYENQEGDFFGANFETGRWFNRNLKIFRNIQRIKVSEEDRILVLFGAGHMNLLNIFFESSPEYELVNTNDYL